MIGKIWTWFDGKKTIIGAIIVVVSYLVAGVPLITPLCGDNVGCVAHVATAAGAGLTLVGLLHKLYKFLYKADAA